MDWSGKNEKEIKETILRLLVHMSRIDGIVHGKELLYLLDIGQIYGYGPEEVRSFMIDADNDAVLPGPEKDRMTILYYLLFLMRIDGKVNVQEENLIFHFGFKLGFSESLIREMLVVIKEHLGSRIPPEKLLEKVKKYLN